MDIIFVALFSTLPYIIAYRNISPYKFNIKDYIHMEISILICYYLLSLINLNLASLSIYFIPITFIYKKSSKILYSVFLDIFICIVIIFSDSCVGIINNTIFNVNLDPTKLSYYVFCLIVLFVVHFISKLINYLLYKYKNYFPENYKSKYAILIYISLIITFGIFYMNINWNTYDTPEYLSKTNSIFFIGYTLILIFIYFISFITIKKEHIFKLKHIQLENLTEYTNNLEELYMDMRRFIHDYINILSSISWFINENDMDSLRDYFSNTIYPLNVKMQSNNYKLGLLKNIEITELKGLISSKLIKAQELDLNVNIDIAEPISHINMDIIDLIRALGILLDNAIEAAISTDDKSIELGIITKKNSIIIVVINSYSEDISSISKLFKEGYSTKGKNRGLGLSNLREIINNNASTLLDTSISNNKFIQKITIKKDF